MRKILLAQSKEVQKLEEQSQKFNVENKNRIVKIKKTHKEIFEEINDVEKFSADVIEKTQNLLKII